MPTAIATSTWSTGGSSNEKPTQPAAAAAHSIWPRPPMLNSPTRNASATPRPAAMSGVAKLSVSVSGLMSWAKPASARDRLRIEPWKSAE